MELRAAALHALTLSNPAEKIAAALVLEGLVTTTPLDTQARLAEPAYLPGRPTRPLLVSPRDVPHRSSATPDGLAHLVHALCHIEFNAINLALDAVWRFPEMPAAYYHDWSRVAAEEAQHFELLRAQLRSLGMDYGDAVAHDGLWDMCRRTQHDVLARMALVPRTLEARGLDVTPGLQRRLRQSGFAPAVAVAKCLDVILRDEVGHVAVGNRWYVWLCEQRHLDPEVHYRQLLHTYGAAAPRPPLNLAARRAAGFTEAELNDWPS